MRTWCVEGSVSSNCLLREARAAASFDVRPFSLAPILAPTAATCRREGMGECAGGEEGLDMHVFFVLITYLHDD